MRNTLFFSAAVILSLTATSLWVSRLKATDYDEGPTFWLTPWITALAAILWVGWFMERVTAQYAN
jgi:hypothetical protein